MSFSDLKKRVHGITVMTDSLLKSMQKMRAERLKLAKN